MFTYREVHKQARDLILYGETKTQLQRSLAVYFDRGALNTPSEAFACAYSAGYEIKDMSLEIAQTIYDLIGEYGDALRDNTVEELIALASINT